MTIKDILRHPKTGLMAVITGCTATATMVTGFVTSFTPLLGIPELHTVHDDIMKIVVPLGLVSVACTFIANFAESIVKFEDQMGTNSDAQPPH